MGIRETLKVIQDFHRRLGLYAPDSAPPLAVLEQFPAVIARISSYEADRYTLSGIRYRRSVELLLYYRAIAVATAEDEVALIELADRIMRNWLEKDAPFRIASIACDGVRYDLPAGDKLYLGTIIHLRVEEE